MKKYNCCGSYIYHASKKETKVLPNPTVKNGVEIIYLGSGNIKVSGKSTKLVYHATDYQRHFKVHADDLDAILKLKYFIKRP